MSEEPFLKIKMFVEPFFKNKNDCGNPYTNENVCGNKTVRRTSHDDDKRLK
jgi:hypothetical protein